MVMLFPTPGATQGSVTVQTDNAGLAKDATLKPASAGDIFNTAVLANTNFFGANLAPVTTPTTFRIYVVLSVSGVLSVIRKNGAPTVAEQMNAGNALAANAAYVFDIPVSAGDTINLQTSVGATILKCSVRELDGATA